MALAGRVRVPLPGGGEQALSQIRTIGIGEPHMRGDAISKKRMLRGCAGAINQLVRHHDVARSELLTQAANGGHRNKPAHPQ